MTFKDCIKADLDVFINNDEFSDVHDINGIEVNCIVQSPTSQEVFQREALKYDDLSGCLLMIHVKANEVPDMPVEGQVWELDGNKGIVYTATVDDGMLTVALRLNVR